MLWLMLLATRPLLAQESSGELRGTVTDIINRIPLKEVEIRVQPIGAFTISGLRGEFILTGVPPGNYQVEFKKPGYQTTKFANQAIRAGQITYLTAEIAPQTDATDDVIVIGGIEIHANKDLLPETAGTTTIVDASDIEHIQATSLGDVLDLGPGMEMKNQPALKDPVTAMIRDPRPLNDLTAFGTKLLVDDIPFTNNANLQGGLLSGVYTGTNSGVDLREFPAENIARVEVIRGVAPANYGDVIGGVVRVTTKSSNRTTYRLKAKNNPDTREVNLGGNLPLASTGLTYNLNWGYSVEDIRKNNDDTQRLAGQFTFRNQFLENRLTITNQFNYSRLFEEVRLNPSDPDALISINKGYRVSVANQSDWRPDHWQRLHSRLAFNYRRHDSLKQNRVPSNNRVVSILMTEGTIPGLKQSGDVLYRYSIIGDEINLGHQLEWSRQFFLGRSFHRVALGNEIEFDENNGPGLDFDVRFPARVGDRPRSFDRVPGLLQHSIYLMDEMTAKWWREFTVNVGLRLERYQTGHLERLQFFGSKNGRYLQPRLNLTYLLDRRTQLRLGYGRTAKAPAIGQICPDLEYIDVQDILTIPRGTDTLLIRDSLMTTYIYDLSNPKLKGIEEEKIELAVDHEFGPVGLSLIGFYAHRNHEPLLQGKPLLYPQYYRSNWPATDTKWLAEQKLRIAYTWSNDGWTQFDGVEMLLRTLRLKWIGTDFMISATYHHAKSSGSGYIWGPVIDDDSTVNLYHRNTSWTQKLLLTYQANYISARLGIWISLTAQQVPHYRSRTNDLSNLEPIAYYDPAINKIMPLVAEKRSATKADPQQSYSVEYRVLNYPNKWLVNVRVSKSLFQGSEVSLYVNNLFNDRAIQKKPFNPKEYQPRNPEIFYGIEWSMLLDRFF